ncbi:MAG: PD-(D/E)XK nuclease family protein, partial [Planctomycetes bacterium]|nr:PD-(D/E)XK nuclease family protein [Planctomycetota bacterium]
MSVRFVIGRAGAGKTDHCLEAVKQALIDSPVDGPALILLVPEQAALQMERAVIDDPRLGAAHRAQVVGFRRLAFRILADAPMAGDGGHGPQGQPQGEPQGEPQALTANGRAMTLRFLLGGLSDRLQYYRRVERLSGFIDRLAHSIGELFDEAVTPQDLIDASAAAGDDDPLRSRKLADLGLIYQAYLDHLGDTKLDPSQYLETARRRMPDCPWLHQADIWVDGFAGFTRQELLALVRLAAVARRIEVTALIDPDEAAVARPLDHAPDPDSTSLFAKTVRTYLGLHRAFSDAGLEIESPLLLRPERPRRFTAGPQLAVLERRLFSHTGAGLTPAGPEDRDGSVPTPGGSAVELASLPDRRVEVDYAVSRIFQWVQRPVDPLRYRDIALIVRDLDPYADLLSAALAERNIPFFIDRRRPTAHHPLVELLRALVTLAADSMSPDSVRLLLKTGLLGVADDAADELENFILAHAVAGFHVWTAGDWRPDVSDARVTRLDQTPAEPSPAQQALADRVNATRTALLDRIGDWLQFARTAGRTDGRTWAKQLAATLTTKLGVGQELARWAEQAEQDGDLDAAEEHRQIWRDTTALLDDLADALADEPLTIGDLASVLEAGLSQFSLGLAPPMLDQVLVGAVQRSRHPNVRAAVVLGFNDGAFPAGGSEDSVLTDDDRGFLADRGVTVGTPRRRQVLDERLLTYVALTRAGQYLLITHPRADAKGEPLRVSPFADDVRAACPSLCERTLGDPTQTRDPWPLMTSNDLAGALALEFQSRPDLVEDDRTVRADWNALYERARGDEQLRRSLAPALSALGHVNDARLSAESAQRLTPGTLQASVSRLESFAACPFRHFAEYSLRLKPRRLAKLEPVDVGTLHHTILEDFIGRLVERGQPLGQLDDAAVLEHLQSSCDRVGI